MDYVGLPPNWREMTQHVHCLLAEFLLFFKIRAQLENDYKSLRDTQDKKETEKVVES